MAMDNGQVLRGIKVLAKAVVVMGVATFFGEQANRVQKMAQGKMSDKLTSGNDLVDRIKFELGLPIRIDYVKRVNNNSGGRGR